MADLRHPSDDDLLAWYLFMMMDSIPPEVFDPPLLKRLIDIYRLTPRLQMHLNLYQQYEEYREQFIQ